MEEIPSIIAMDGTQFPELLSYMLKVSDLSSKIILIIYLLTTQLGPSATLLKIENCKPPDLQMDSLPRHRTVSW